MLIPEHIQKCMNRLEQAGFSAYIVGGCVRDSCLGLEPHDWDMCTSALPEQTEAVFSDHRLVLAGKKHGTVSVVTEGDIVEITTYRTEGDYTDNRHPEWVKFVPDIREDLARRDFTVNAMAYSPTRGFADPFGGREDLSNHTLRAVGDARARFREDSLRILRGVRFAAKYRLVPEQDTLDAMIELRGLMDNLARERVFDELCKLLLVASAEDLVRFAPILAAAIPELEPMIGFDQRSPHHSFDVFTHTAYVCEAVPAALPLKWAALLHDVGKIPCFSTDENGRGHFYGHAQKSAEMADVILLRLKAPTALREQVVTLIDQHMASLTPDAKLLRRRMSRLGPDTVVQLLALQRADFGSKGVMGEHADFEEVAQVLQQIQSADACLTVQALAVNGYDMMDLGYEGKAIGVCLESLLNQVLDDQLPNEKTALLKAAEEMRRTQA